MFFCWNKKPCFILASSKTKGKAVKHGTGPLTASAATGLWRISLWQDSAVPLSRFGHFGQTRPAGCCFCSKWSFWWKEKREKSCTNVENDGMIFYSDMFIKVLVVATFILVWSPGLFWGHTLCVACQLPISKGGGESKVPNPSYPKFHFQKLPFEDCIISSLFPTEHFRCHDMIFAFLACCIREACKNVMLKYVEICWWLPAFDETWQSFDLKQATCYLYLGCIPGKLTFHHFNLMVLIDLMSLGGFVHRHRSLLLSPSKKHKEAPCNGFPLVFCSSNIRGHFDQSAWQILQDAMAWMKRLGAEMLTFYFKLRPFKLGKSSSSRGICCQFDWEHLWLWLQTVEVLRLPELKLYNLQATVMSILFWVQRFLPGSLPDRMSWKMWHMLALTMRSIRTAALGETVDTNNKIRRMRGNPWTLGYVDKSNEYISISYIDISKSKLTATWSDWFLKCRVCSLEGRVPNRNWLCWQD